jgi:hypothetical protein
MREYCSYLTTQTPHKEEGMKLLLLLEKKVRDLCSRLTFCPCIFFSLPFPLLVRCLLNMLRRFGTRRPFLPSRSTQSPITKRTSWSTCGG